MASKGQPHICSIEIQRASYPWNNETRKEIINRSLPGSPQNPPLENIGSVLRGQVDGEGGTERVFHEKLHWMRKSKEIALLHSRLLECRQNAEKQVTKYPVVCLPFEGPQSTTALEIQMKFNFEEFQNS